MITIPEEVTKIAGDAFSSSKGATLSSPNALVCVRPDSFPHQYAKTHGMKIPSSVKIQVETYKVTGVAENAFKDAAKVKKIKMGKNITSIEKSSFVGKKKKIIYIKPQKGDIGSVQSALNFALTDKTNQFYIKVPKGKYTGRMYIYSNTTVDMRAGAVLKRTGGAGCMITLVGSGTKRNKYNAGKHIAQE